MEKETDSMDKKIDQLKTALLRRYDEQILKIDRDIAAAKDNAIESVVVNRAAFVKELDDRLALIRKFPSVLDADRVEIVELTGNGTKQINDNWGRFNMYLDEGKWKVLILAKRIV